MKALAIPQPIANDIILAEQSLIGLPFSAGNVTEFLLTATEKPMKEEYTLGLASGVMLGIITITKCVKSPEFEDLFEWEVKPKYLVKPVNCQVSDTHFEDIVEHDYLILRDETEELMTWLAHKDTDFDDNLQAYADQLIQLGVTQMPKYYQDILAQTKSWKDVDRAWLTEQEHHHHNHMEED